MTESLRIECRECGETKDSGEFFRWWKRSGKGWCRSCRNAYQRRRTGAKPKVKRVTEAGVLCGHCKRILPIDRYWWRDRGYGPEPAAYCKECQRDRRAEDARALAEFRRMLP